MSSKSFFKFVLVFALSLFGFSRSGHAQVSKAHQILIDRGLQVQGMAEAAIFHLSTYTNAHYTSINWGYSSDPSQAPVFPWSGWVSDITNMPPMGSEAPYMSQLVSLSLSDEPFLNSQFYFDKMLNWFTNVQNSYPNTILYINNWGGEVEDGPLSSFIAQARPDMISFDFYPWQSDYYTHVPFALSQTWYGELRRYKAWASAYNIPYGIYRQTFHAVEEPDPTNNVPGRIYRDPSASEMRLNTFGALAFNAKMLIDFTYNSGASSLFDRDEQGQWHGDTLTNALYNEMVDINQRAVNFGKALVFLKPVYEMHNTNTVNPPPGPGSDDQYFPNGYCTSVMFLRGKSMSGSVTNFNPLPDSFYNDPSSATNSNLINSSAYSWWEFPKNDPYLTGWSMTNKAGVMNNGLPGDVIISWFHPLDEIYDGTNYTNEVYMMVVNALTATNGTAADCMQEIKLTFSGLTGAMTNLIMLDPVTGQWKTNGLPVFSTKRQLTLDLNGGDAVLFKFNTGAPFVGHVPPSAVRLTATTQAGTPGISVQGTVGAHYQLQTTSALLGVNNWTTVTNLYLPTSTYVFTNMPSVNTTNSYYRVVGIP
ncbi:hypothetical protein [Pedosphaera parvula]|uniref:Uncharacterized protein n=1 Tax=Pedosphaera parvula (strain Ellin514) TaxID=320771 RepID=B9XAC0_PEDPL|nr:hypothetical protein [Pedosphaera parvula]EEF63461.1 hypothetical protein Cflav_PD6096 [Pedosphaera parvula Ellin514]